MIESDGDATAACLYLAEIPARFPGTVFAAESETRMIRLACGSNDLDAVLPPEGSKPQAAADLADQQ